MDFDYFYEGQADQYVFYRIPKVLIVEDFFEELSTDAKLLYGLLLDRVSLSASSGWIDEQKRVYIIYTLKSIERDLHCCEKTAVKLLKELEQWKLIERVRQGQGKPSLVYVKNFFGPLQNIQFKTSNIYSSGPVNVTAQDLEKYRVIILIKIISILIILILSYPERMWIRMREKRIISIFVINWI